MLREAALTLGYYAVPLILTILIESGAAYLCGLKKEEQHALLLCNLLTNPLLNLILYAKHYATGTVSLPAVLLLEAAVVLGEGFLLRQLCGKQRRYFALSLLFNTFSYGTGLLLAAMLF